MPDKAESGVGRRCQAIAPFEGFSEPHLRCCKDENHAPPWHENGGNRWTDEENA